MPHAPQRTRSSMQMHNTPLHRQPAVKMFGMLGRILLTDPTTDELRTGQLIFCPDILEQLGICKKTSVEYHSAEYQRQLLQSPTRCKQFIGRSVYQYFEIDTEPPGKYEGTVISKVILPVFILWIDFLDLGFVVHDSHITGRWVDLFWNAPRYYCLNFVILFSFRT